MFCVFYTRGFIEKNEGLLWCLQAFRGYRFQILTRCFETNRSSLAFGVYTFPSIPKPPHPGSRLMADGCCVLGILRGWGRRAPGDSAATVAPPPPRRRAPPGESAAAVAPSHPWVGPAANVRTSPINVLHCRARALRARHPSTSTTSARRSTRSGGSRGTCSSAALAVSCRPRWLGAASQVLMPPPRALGGWRSPLRARVSSRSRRAPLLLLRERPAAGRTRHPGRVPAFPRGTRRAASALPQRQNPGVGSFLSPMRAFDQGPFGVVATPACQVEPSAGCPL